MKYLVAGNYAKFSVTLTQKSGELIVPYIPTEGDVVQISLYGARRFDYPNYEQVQNVLTFEDNGCLQVGLYCLEVKITEANTHKLRCMYREQIRVVASNDDVPTDASFSDDDIQLIGQFDIAASVEITIDDELSLTSTNPVQNKVVTAALDGKSDSLVSDGAGAGGFDYSLKSGNTVLSTIEIPFADNGSEGGLMRDADKTKLDGIEAGANKTIVDIELNGLSSNPVENRVVTRKLDTVTQKLATKYDNFYKDFYPDAIDFYFMADGEYVAEWYIESATTTAAGLMSAADKSKLDALPTNSDLQAALNAKGDALAGDMTAAGYEIDLKSGNTSLSQVYIPFAAAQTDGLMSASDYSKLAALPTNAGLITALAGKQDTLTFDSVPTQNSTNPVTSGGLYSTLLSKEDKVSIEAPVNSVDAEQPITTLTTETGKYYRIDVAVETFAVSLPAMTDSTKIANVVLMLTGGTTPAVTISSTAPSGGTVPDVYYQDGFAIDAGKTYEVNCLWNGAAWVVAAVEIIIS